MRRTAGTSDDDFEARSLRTLGERIKTLRRTMRRYNTLVVGYTERIKRVGGVLHGLPVRLAAHDNGDGFRSQLRHQNPLREGSAAL